MYLFSGSPSCQISSYALALAERWYAQAGLRIVDLEKQDPPRPLSLPWCLLSLILVISVISTFIRSGRSPKCRLKNLIRPTDKDVLKPLVRAKFDTICRIFGINRAERLCWLVSTLSVTVVSDTLTLHLSWNVQQSLNGEITRSVLYWFAYVSNVKIQTLNLAVVSRRGDAGVTFHHVDWANIDPHRSEYKYSVDTYT